MTGTVRSLYVPIDKFEVYAILEFLQGEDSFEITMPASTLKMLSDSDVKPELGDQYIFDVIRKRAHEAIRPE